MNYAPRFSIHYYYAPRFWTIYLFSALSVCRLSVPKHAPIQKLSHLMMGGCGYVSDLSPSSAAAADALFWGVQYGYERFDPAPRTGCLVFGRGKDFYFWNARPDYDYYYYWRCEL